MKRARSEPQVRPLMRRMPPPPTRARTAKQLWGVSSPSPSVPTSTAITTPLHPSAPLPSSSPPSAVASRQRSAASAFPQSPPPSVRLWTSLRRLFDSFVPQRARTDPRMLPSDDSLMALDDNLHDHHDDHDDEREQVSSTPPSSIPQMDAASSSSATTCRDCRVPPPRAATAPRLSSHTPAALSAHPDRACVPLAVPGLRLSPALAIPPASGIATTSTPSPPPPSPMFDTNDLYAPTSSPSPSPMSDAHHLYTSTPSPPTSFLAVPTPPSLHEMPESPASGRAPDTPVCALAPSPERPVTDMFELELQEDDLPLAARPNDADLFDLQRLTSPPPPIRTAQEVDATFDEYSANVMSSSPPPPVPRQLFGTQEEAIAAASVPSRQTFKSLPSVTSTPPATPPFTPQQTPTRRRGPLPTMPSFGALALPTPPPSPFLSSTSARMRTPPIPPRAHTAPVTPAGLSGFSTPAPSPSPAPRRATLDAAVLDDRLALLNELQAQLRFGRDGNPEVSGMNDVSNNGTNAADVTRSQSAYELRAMDALSEQRRSAIVSQQRRLASSMRIPKVGDVPRNVRLPFPGKRRRHVTPVRSSPSSVEPTSNSRSQSPTDISQASDEMT